MSTVEEIRTAIQKLSLEERAQITAELCGWTDDEWDCQMRDAAAAGKFAALNQEADSAEAAGQTRPLNDLFHGSSLLPRSATAFLALAAILG